MKINKKHISFSTFVFLTLVIFSHFVSAAPGDTVDKWFNTVASNDVVRFVVGDFHEGAAGTSELFFIKALVFILLILLVSYAARKIPNLGEHTSIVLLISIIVSLIATRYITNEALIKTIWLPYGVLGVFLATLLPFILGYFFIESFNSRMFRKVAWSLYVVIFASLAYFRWNDLQLNFGESGIWSGGWIYLATAILSLIMILFDSWIRKMKYKAQYDSAMDERKKKAAINFDIRIEEEYDKLERTSNPTTISAIKARIDDLKGQRNRVLN